MPMTTSVATALTNGLHGIAAIALAWLALSLALCLVEAALTGSIRITGRFAPGFVRRLVAVMLGMSSVLGGVSNGLIISQAAEPLPQPIPGSATGSAVSPMVALLAGLPLPERPVLDPGPSTPRAPAANAEPGSSYGSGRSDGAHREAVTVRTGDSLWAIAERLGLDWQDLYRHNVAVIGDDPDLIHPGQRLAVPASIVPRAEHG